MNATIVNRKISFSDPLEIPFLCPSDELFRRNPASAAPAPFSKAFKDAALRACGGGGGGVGGGGGGGVGGGGGGGGGR